MDGFTCCLHETPRDFDWCENNCGRYYHCDTVAWADDKLKEVGACASVGSPKTSDSNMLYLYEVTITETLQKTVKVNASTSGEAEQIISDDWYNSEHILDAGDFKGVDFEARRVDKDGGG